MRPLRSFLLLLIFMACFTGLHYIIPANQLFPPISAFVPADLITYLLSVESPSPVNSAEPVTDIKNRTAVNSITHSDSVSLSVKNTPADSFRGFLDSLRYSGGQIRVIYYGDSQIEGDRITSYLRKTLRKGKGGTGPGLFLPLMPIMYTKSIWLRSSSNWKKYNYLSYKKGEISHRDLGPFMAICRYLPEGKRAQVPVKAYVRIRASNVADSSASEYDNLRIFYGDVDDVVHVSVKADGYQIFADNLQSGKGINEIGCPLGRAKEIFIEFESVVSPDIYGISIESKTGVIVDNIPQRGSAGLEFTMVGKVNLSETYRKLRPDLIVLHYGLNIVKNVRDEYSYFRKGLARQLVLLKEISPSTPILVISLTDMAEKTDDGIKSYQNIPAIINAQKRASRETGAAFWDSYGSMGGESSIIKWAKKIPPLAQEDYVHLTYQGADTLSCMLVSSMFVNKGTDTVPPANTFIASDTVPVVPVVNNTGTQIVTSEKKLAESLLSSLLNYDPDKPFIFTSPLFWIFFLFVLAGYSLLYKKLVIRNVYLFLISLFFYYKAGGLFLFILIFVTLIDFSCGLLLYRAKRVGVRRFIVLLSLISNLGLLAYFKYTGFIISSINELFGTHLKVYDMLSAFSNSILQTSFDINYIILPVGVSFFTFQSLSYIIDIYRQKVEPVRNIIDFGFYVSFFPHLVAGPIVRASVFIPQIYQEFRLNRHEFSHALFMISKGLIKKIVISNFIAINLVDRVFDAPSIYSGFENLMAIYGYGLQIYCDFSGYTDIAIGIALMLGFRLPLNFNSPYKAKSITDFWKRWHISLSNWLRDYLYISLGGNRNGRIRAYVNLMITMLLGGLWHGPSLKYVIWGGLHGIGLVINKLWDHIFKSSIRFRWIGRALSIFITFQFINFCWIFFRAPDIGSVNIMLNQIIENFSPGSYMTVIPAYFSTILLIAVGYAIHFLPEKVKESYRGLFIRIPLAAQLVCIMAVAILLYQMRTTEVIPFIYFRF